MVSWTCLVPNLPVRDVAAAQAWYRDTLGLRVNWLWEDNFGSVSKDHVELFLYESVDPRPVICMLRIGTSLDEAPALELSLDAGAERR